MGKIKLVLLAVLMILATGCKGGFTELVSEGAIEGYIRDIITNEPVGGATVQIADISYITNGDGYFPLVRDTNNEDEKFLIPNSAGNSYSIRRSDYYYKNSIVMLKYGQKNLLGYVCPRPNGKKYLVTGWVEKKTGGYLENAKVIVNTSFDSSGYVYMTETDKQGRFSFIDVPEGKINIYIYKDGYTSKSQIHSLKYNYTDVKFVVESDDAARYGEIHGNINDEKGNLCDYAKISIGHENSNYHQFTIADNSGSFILRGVPQGQAQIAVKAPGFYKEGLAQVSVTPGAVTIKNVTLGYLDYSEE